VKAYASPTDQDPRGVKVPGADQGDFEKLAAKAKAGCPFPAAQAEIPWTQP